MAEVRLWLVVAKFHAKYQESIFVFSDTPNLALLKIT